MFGPSGGRTTTEVGPMAARPSIALNTFTETVRRALERFSEQRARTERAALLVALGNVQRVTDEAYAVISQSRPDVVYSIRAGTYRERATGCVCEDKVNRKPASCVHEYSVDLVQVAQERQRRLELRARFTAAELER